MCGDSNHKTPEHPPESPIKCVNCDGPHAADNWYQGYNMVPEAETRSDIRDGLAAIVHLIKSTSPHRHGRSHDDQRYDVSEGYDVSGLGGHVSCI